MMKLRISSLIVLSALFILSACDKPEKLTTEDGIEYYLLSSENGEAYGQKDYGTFFLKMLNAEDSVLIDSEEVGLLPLKMDSASLKRRGSLFSILKEMKVGDSVRTTLSASEVFTQGFRQPLSDDMQPGDRITVFAAAKEKFDSAGFMDWQMKMQREAIARRQKQEEILKVEEKDVIQDYLPASSL